MTSSVPPAGSPVDPVCECGHPASKHHATDFQCGHVLNPQALCRCKLRREDIWRATVSQRDAEIAALREDKERLDWMERQTWVEAGITDHSDNLPVKIQRYGPDGLDWVHMRRSFRAAIDAARSGTQEETNRE